MGSLKMALVTLVIFLILDFAWIGGLMSEFYFKEMGPFTRRNGAHLTPKWISVAFVYFFIILGLVYFVYPTVQDMSALKSFLQGALFGLVLYGVHDMTNHAFIKQYSLKLAIVDIFWGAFACGFTTLFVKYLSKKLGF